MARLGRKTRLPEKQREILWDIFRRVLEKLAFKGLSTKADLYTSLADVLREKETRPYTITVIDEAQDLSIPQLKFLAALSSDGENCLFFASDLGQRIFQTPYSWKSLGRC